MSPLKVQARLTASGMRPVSNVVDATNYAMLELGQPLHAFDMDRLTGPGIVVRYARDGERLVTLDDVERTLTSEDLLICDLERPVALAGVMGGATSEVSEETRDILLESAYFTRTGVLRTARRLDLHSEASHRFERGADPEGLERAAARCAQLITAWAGGRLLGGVARSGSAPDRSRVAMRPSRASMLLDYEVTAADAGDVFDRLGMAHRAPGRPHRGRDPRIPGRHRPGGGPHRGGRPDAGIRPHRLRGAECRSGGRRAGALRVPRARARRPCASGTAGGVAALVRVRGGPRAHR